MAPDELRGHPPTRRDVVSGRGQGRPFVVGQRKPADAVGLEAIPPVAGLAPRPRGTPVGLERQQADIDPAATELTQIGQHLRLHQRFAQAEVTEIEGAHGANRSRDGRKILGHAQPTEQPPHGQFGVIGQARGVSRDSTNGPGEARVPIACIQI